MLGRLFSLGFSIFNGVHVQGGTPFFSCAKYQNGAKPDEALLRFMCEEWILV